MVNSTAFELLAEIRKRRCRLRFHRWWISLMGVVAGLAAWAQSPLPLLAAVIGAVVGTPFLWLWDRRRKTIDLHYDLEAAYGGRYLNLLQAFQAFCTTQRIWVVEAEAEVRDRKYHAGATRSITRDVIVPRFQLPEYFRSNVTPPMLPAGRQTLYLFPDAILVFDGGRVGAVGYDQLDTDASAINFVEEESVPRDSRQMDITWRFVNKRGSPDQRFNNNRQLPVMEYGVLRWRSHTGLNEEFHTSRPDAAVGLSSGLRGMIQRLPAARAPAT